MIPTESNTGLLSGDEVIPIIIHHDKDSCFGVTVPGLPGCFSSGDTMEEACQNVKEAIDLHIDSLVEEAGGDVDKVRINVCIEKALNEARSDGGIVVVIEHTIKHDITFDV